MNQNREELPKYTVIKLAKLLKSTKNENELIFKDESGRIYFMDRKSNHDLVKELPIGEYHHVWVVKESEKIGYVRTNINGMHIVDYLMSLVGLTYEDYLEMEEVGRDDVLFLTNYMYNHDIEFNKFLKNQNPLTLSVVAVNLFNHFDKTSRTDEWSEWLVEKAILDFYMITGAGGARRSAQMQL